MENNKKKLIILIEDEEALVRILENRFKRAGYKIRSAHSGKEGLELISKLKPDLVLLDMMLPGLNGFDVLEELNTKGIIPKLPLIIISNSGQPIEIERAISLGARDYLIKVNFDPDELLLKVDKTFEAQEKENAAGNRQDSESEILKSKSILIVEDDTFLVELLSKKLKNRNYNVYTAIDAPQARNIMQSNKIDLILLDIVLPGTDGFSFLEELKADEKYKHIPVVIISNLGQSNEVERGRNLGADDFIIKANTSPEEIVSRIEKILINKQSK